MPEPACSRPSEIGYQFGDYLGDYLGAVSEHWLKVAPLSNPAMLEMFGDRDRRPLRRMVPWAGEFAGKYLTGATEVLRLTGDKELEAVLSEFVGRLVSLQDGEGYLGPWPRGYHLANKAPNNRPEDERTWDTWGHYHIMLGLLLWYQDTGSSQAMAAARAMADLFCRKYLGPVNPRLVDTGSTEMNLAIVHALSLLHRLTGESTYLRMALQIVDEFSALDDEGRPLAGDYLNSSLAGRQFHQMPKPRWESLHAIMALPELYYITGRREYRTAFEGIWKSIVRLDRHNNGGFSSDERAQGNPYHRGAIETCCTIAWMALSVEMLRLTRDPLVADELELSTINSVIGMHSVSGRWVTYDTPMDGVRKSSTQSIAFQAREGSPELNCCSVNGARGFGILSDWAVMSDEEGVILNWFGRSSIHTRLASGSRLRLTQETDYPRTGRIHLRIQAEPKTRAKLRIRVPRWSEGTTIEVDGADMGEVQSGSYFAIERTWQDERIFLSLDMAPHYWIGSGDCSGKTSLYRGPVLLTYDRRFNEMDPGDLPEMDAGNLGLTPDEWRGSLPPMMLLDCPGMRGREIRLCDFGSAGGGGSPYMSWLPIRNVPRGREFWSSWPEERSSAGSDGRS